MNTDKLILKIILVITIILSILVVTLSIVGSQKRLGYITDIYPYNIGTSKGLYRYEGRIRSHDAIFKHSDIFNIYPVNDNLQTNTIKNIEVKEYGKPYTYFTTDKEIDLLKNIDVYYIVKIKPNIISFLIPLIFLCVVLTLQNKVVKTLPNKLINKITTYFLALSLIAITAVFIFYNLKNAAWLFGDDHQQLKTIVQGKMLGLSIFASIKRFWPIGLLHLNLLLPFGNNPFLYLLQYNLFLIGMMLILFFILSKYSNKIISLFLILILTLFPDTMRIYAISIFAESFILLLLAFFAFMYKKAIDTNKTVYYVAAFFVCVYATYCKEPICVLFAVFALTHILFDYKNLTKKQKYFLYALLINAVIFAGLYMYVIKGVSGGRYGKTDLGIIPVLFQYLRRNNIFIIFVIIALIRAFYILIKKDRRFIIFDAYLYGGVAYSCAYIILKLTTPYYLTPSYICYVLALSGYLKHIFDNIKTEHKEYKFNSALIFILFIIFAIQAPKTVDIINGIIKERKKTNWETETIANLDNLGYELYMYFPSEPKGTDGYELLNTFYVLNTFVSIYKNNGKYIDGDKPIILLYNTNTIYTNKKTAIIYDVRYGLPNQYIEGANKTNFNTYGGLAFGAGMFVQNEENNEVSLIIENAKKKYIK